MIVLLIFSVIIIVLVIVGVFSTRSANRKQREADENKRKAIEKYRSDLIEKYGEEVGVKLFNSEYFIGMTIAQLIDSKGRPTAIEKEELKTKTKFTYIYGNKSLGDVFVFENGILAKFKDR